MLRFEPWKIILVLGVTLLGLIYAVPNLLSRETADSLPEWLPHRQVNLGLDLQGGSHLLLEVNLQAVITEYVESLIDDVRAALRAENVGYTGIGRRESAVILKLRDPAVFEQARKLIEEISDEIEVAIDAEGNTVVALSDDAIGRRQQSVVNQSIEIVRRRIDETGTREPSIQRQGENRILVQLPGVDDPERIKRILGKTAKMNFRMVDETTPIEDALRGRIPPGSELLYEIDPRINNGEPIPVVVRKRIGVSGDSLTDAQPTFQDGQPVVSLRFDSVGARKFAELTTDNVGRRFAIVLDSEVISAPVVREPIPGGSAIISGNFTVQSANDLALLLRAGALPAPLNVIEERTVGPSLGADSIRAGTSASVIAMLLVAGYMLLLYGLFGVVADIALVVNVIMIISAMSVLGATLTLPGIAGIALTIGNAVDANVLIYERIREEVRIGRSPFSALDIGFQQAMRAIIDSNVTSLIAAALLYQFGSGSIRGFAVTLVIGLLTSMFTSVMLSRLIIVIWIKRVRPKQLPV